MAYCDFMKAFEKVSHEKLIQELELYNIGNTYPKWILTFFRCRNSVGEWRKIGLETSNQGYAEVVITG